MRSARPWLAAAILAALFALIYLPDLGHGFLSDDFHWIAVAQLHAAGDLARIFTSNTGFYRPLVTLSFTIDSAMWHLDPRGYALTNLLLLVADAALLFVLARQLALPPAGALFAAAVWLFNFHGINMALLWTSGRTALLLCLFALASVVAFLRGRLLAATLFAFAAMLCKEEAVMLPPLLCAIEFADRRDASAALRRIWPTFVALIVYAVLRERSGAFGPFNAPSFYRLTWQPHALALNVVQYLDRGATWPMVAAAVVTLAAASWRPLEPADWRVLRIGIFWFVAMYAVTVLIVVRSSLYAVAPSIGSALVAGLLASRSWRADAKRFSVAASALIIGVAAAVPVYRARNDSFVAFADLSTTSLHTIRGDAAAHGPVDTIVLVDDPREPVTLRDAFGALFPDAVRLFVDPQAMGAIVTSRAAAPAGAARTAVFELRKGELVQLP